LQGSKASLTFVFDSIKKNIIASHTTGRFTQFQYQESLLKCRNVSDKIFSFYRDIVKKVHQEHDSVSPECGTWQAQKWWFFLSFFFLHLLLIWYILF
jgi:hypothetical protein